MLDQGARVCAGRGPEVHCSEGFADQGPSCCVVTAHAGMYLGEKLLPLLFGDAPLKDPRSAPFIELALMDLVCFRAPDYASCLRLIIREFLS
jgi:hypothetical protein